MSPAGASQCPDAVSSAPSDSGALTARFDEIQERFQLLNERILHFAPDTSSNEIAVRLVTLQTVVSWLSGDPQELLSIIEKTKYLFPPLLRRATATDGHERWVAEPFYLALDFARKTRTSERQQRDFARSWAHWWIRHAYPLIAADTHQGEWLKRIYGRLIASALPNVAPWTNKRTVFHVRNYMEAQWRLPDSQLTTTTSWELLQDSISMRVILTGIFGGAVSAAIDAGVLGQSFHNTDVGRMMEANSGFHLNAQLGDQLRDKWGHDLDLWPEWFFSHLISLDADAASLGREVILQRGLWRRWAQILVDSFEFTVDGSMSQGFVDYAVARFSSLGPNRNWTRELISGPSSQWLTWDLVDLNPLLRGNSDQPLRDVYQIGWREHFLSVVKLETQHGGERGFDWFKLIDELAGTVMYPRATTFFLSQAIEILQIIAEDWETEFAAIQAMVTAEEGRREYAAARAAARTRQTAPNAVEVSRTPTPRASSTPVPRVVRPPTPLDHVGGRRSELIKEVLRQMRWQALQADHLYQIYFLEPPTGTQAAWRISFSSAIVDELRSGEAHEVPTERWLTALFQLGNLTEGTRNADGVILLDTGGQWVITGSDVYIELEVNLRQRILQAVRFGI